MAARWNDGRRFEGRVAIVTGASGALGGASARALAREGASVALAYRSGAEAAAKAVDEIAAAGGTAHAAHLDITDEGSVQAFVEGAVARYGGIDVLINAAGRIDAADAVRFADTDPRRLGRALRGGREGHLPHVPRRRAAHGGAGRRRHRQLRGLLRQRRESGEHGELGRRLLLRGQGRRARLHRLARARPRAPASGSTPSRRGRSRRTGTPTGASRPSTSRKPCT